MKATTVLCVAIAATAFAGPASAVFKCTTTKGILYQDRPCREGNESDVRLTVPTGQVAPGGMTTPDDGASAQAHRSEERTVKPDRVGDGSTNPAKRSEQKMERVASDARNRSKDAPVTSERTVPMTADQASKMDPSAKYFATESFSSGNQTPIQLNCESPTGEKRMFYLSDGKLTSI